MKLAQIIVRARKRFKFSIAGIFFLGIISPGCHSHIEQTINSDHFLVVLGTAQDAGYPQAGCDKECCVRYWQGESIKKMPASLGIVDRSTDQSFLIEATPDITEQLYMLSEYAHHKTKLPDAILLTHAHIGHYSGLVHLGREVIGAEGIPVYAMPKMAEFLSSNGPWNQLVKLRNIELKPLADSRRQALSPKIFATPILVPHRDEYSETVGFRIEGPNKKVLFIPDIDKWQKWDRDLVMELQKVDIAFLDGTFYENGELPNRDMSEIPHPFVSETIKYLERIPESEKAKVHFIHFNHTNPILSFRHIRTKIERQGFNVAYQGQVIPL